MIMKFAIGEVPAEHAKAVQEEERQHGSFLRIPIEQVFCSVVGIIPDT